MNKVSVQASRSYEVLIERGILINAGKEIHRIHNPCKAAIITDDIVERLYCDAVAASLAECGFSTCRFSFPNGETSKTLGTYEDILNFLAESYITRSDIIIALGGGVVGDLAGFAAASYLRGIDFIQIPTTYLAAVDSSAGGKTGLNLRAGKNLCGAFYQPFLVMIDCNTFKTLPQERFSDGTAETIKYGLIADESLFKLMETGLPDERIDEIVERCIKIKASFITQDEYDNGARRLLNFGHTFGHAIERCSNYGISHGHSVGIGMLMAAGAAWNMGLSAENCAPRIARALESNSLPLGVTYSINELTAAMAGDKKRRGDNISLILPNRIGNCRIHDIPVDELVAFVTSAFETTASIC